jgi:hypothetical protein
MAEEAGNRRVVTRRPGPVALIAVAGLAVWGAAACSSDEPAAEVRGEVVTRDDGTLGGPSSVVAEFRAGERAVYGSNPGAPGEGGR